MTPDQPNPEDLLKPSAPPISPALAAIIAGQGAAAEDEKAQRAELRGMDADACEALIVLGWGIHYGLIEIVGLCAKDGVQMVEVVVKAGDQRTVLPFKGMNLVDAVVRAGQDVHEQLAMLAGKSPRLKDYMAGTLMRRKLRAERLIATPGSN